MKRVINEKGLAWSSAGGFTGDPTSLTGDNTHVDGLPPMNKLLKF